MKEKTRNAKLHRRYFKEFGYTDRRKGCAGVKTGDEKIPKHSDECREYVEEKI